MVRPSRRGGVPVFRRVQLQPERSQLIAEQLRWRLAVATAAILRFADVRKAIQERPGGDYHRARSDGSAVPQQDARHASLCGKRQRRNFGLLDSQVRLLLQNLAHAYAIPLLIHLRARRPNGRAATGIQQAELDTDRIRHLAHYATQGIDLPHEVPLGDAANRGIARHLRDEIEIHRHHGGLQAQPGAGARSLAAGMAGADHHDVVILAHVMIVAK